MGQILDSLDQLPYKGFRQAGQTLDLGAGSLFNGRLNLTTLSGGEHLLYNSWSENNVLGLANLSASGYSAIAIRDNLQREKTAWGYGNLSSTSPAGYAFLEISDASTLGTAPGFLLMQTTDYGTGRPYGQYKRLQLTPDGNLYLFPIQNGNANDPETYCSFKQSADGQQVRFGPDNGHCFDFTHNGFNPKLKWVGGSGLILNNGTSDVALFASGKFGFGGTTTPTHTVDVFGDMGVPGATANGTSILQVLGGSTADFAGSSDAGAEFFQRWQGASFNVNGGGVVVFTGLEIGGRKDGTWNNADAPTNGVKMDFVIRTSFGGGSGSNPTVADRFIVKAAGNLQLNNSAAVPSSNNAGGGYLYAQAGALKWRGSSGTVTQLAAA